MRRSLTRSLPSSNRYRACLLAITCGCAVVVFPGCGAGQSESETSYCAPKALSKITLSEGSARAFLPDPIVASGNAFLSPAASNLDSYARDVTFDHLTGKGVLEGTYVDVRNGDDCSGDYGAYDPDNRFSFAHSDPRFQETMTYYWGDWYRSKLDATEYLERATGGVISPMRVYARCPARENAYYFSGASPDGGRVEYLCLGYSAATPGAHYADDAMVTLHELQHATTTHAYSSDPEIHLNQFWYDEAGALNEAVSDFMAMMYEEPFVAAGFDARLFSRWALGTFIPNRAANRGAHRCPAYDPSYPACTGFPSFSGATNTISYVYPDGMGWPYANNFKGPGYVADAFGKYRGQEEIHNAAVLLEGALWDVYEAVKANYRGDADRARELMTKLVIEAVKHLPKPQRGSSPPVISPVTYPALAAQMVLYASVVGLSPADEASMAGALTARGLLNAPQLASGWAVVGSGNASVTPGLRVQDNPPLLKEWLLEIFGSINAGFLVPQGSLATALNGKLDPGELAAIWFDIQNSDPLTAGGVLVTVTSLDAGVTFDEKINGESWISPTQAQVMYGKVNGTAIRDALRVPGNPTYDVATANSYFLTNPFFDSQWTTALWVRVASTVARGSTARFQVHARPANGAASTVTFTATIN